MATQEEIRQQLAINGSGAKGDSFLWKALGYLGRPASAVTGLVTQPNPEQAFMRGLSGEQTYGGAEIIKAAGGDPKTAGGGYLAPALDILNPLDPLMYVGGLGALTKTGKAAQATKTLVKGAEAFGKGQRSLLSFAGRNLVPGAIAEPIVAGLGKVAAPIAESKPAKALAGIFSKEAAMRNAGIDPENIKTFMAAQKEGGKASALFTAKAQPYLATFEKASKLAEHQSLLQPDVMRNTPEMISDLADMAKNGALGHTPDEIRANVAQRFTGKPEVVKAWDAFTGLRDTIAQTRGEVEGSANSALKMIMEASDLPFAPHVTLFGKGVSEKMSPTGEALRKGLTGLENNAINRDLHPSFIEPVGKEHYKVPKGFDWSRATAEDLAKLPRVEAALIPNEAQHIGTRMGSYVSQMADYVESSTLVRHMVDAGVAIPADAVKSFPGEWSIISGGIWKDTPIAIPKGLADAAEKYQELTRNPVTAGALGRVYDKFMHLWKATTLLPPRRLSVNLITGLVRNAEEGMTFRPGHFMRDSVHYANAYEMMRDVMKADKRGKSVLDLTGDYTIGGEKIPKALFWRKFEEYRMHGGQPGQPGFVMSELPKGEQEAVKTLLSKVDAVVHGNAGGRFNPYNLMRNAAGREEVFMRVALAQHAMAESFDAFKSAGKGLGKEELETAFSHAGDRVLKAHFDYNAASYTPQENAIARWAVPFYRWYRNNIPYEFANAIQHPGQYTHLLNATYNAYKTQELNPEDAPEWLRADFAVPIARNKDTGNQQYFDPVNVLPQGDIANVLGAAFGPKKPGLDRAANLARYGTGLANPLFTTLAEQGLNRDSFTGRELANKPEQLLGIPMNARARNILDLVGPLTWADRFNPKGVFTKIGQQTGAVPESGIRPNVNEPSEGNRALRALFGIKTYEPDPTSANMTRRQWAIQAKRYLGKAKGADSPAQRKYYQDLAQEALANAR